MITGNTGLTGLLGSPVRHSISPRMHNEAFRLLGLDYVYLCFDVTEDRLSEAVRGLLACGIRGFNLTMPNKNRMVELLDRTAGAASLVGAVNTVVCENGKMTGYNTDGVGYMRALKEQGFDISGAELVLLGGGGAASAILAQAALDGAGIIHVFLRNGSRFRGRMEKLALQASRETGASIRLHSLEDERDLADCVEKSSLLINATSVGMDTDRDETLIRDCDVFREDLLVSDVIYHPRQTRLLREAASKGCRTFNGLSMLLYQGAEAFRLWTGRDMPVDEIRTLVLEG